MKLQECAATPPTTPLLLVIRKCGAAILFAAIKELFMTQKVIPGVSVRPTALNSKLITPISPAKSALMVRIQFHVVLLRPRSMMMRIQTS